jgi:inosine-uridine nucleoside N-ribohydrolase
MQKKLKNPEIIKILIDTDIGTDIDDAYAVVYAEKHPLDRKSVV